MAYINTDNESRPDTGTPFKLVVRICGLAAIGAIFLPFIAHMSILDLFKNMQTDGFGATLKLLVHASSTMGSVTNVLLLLSFVAYPILGLSMLARGKYSGGQFTFLLLYNLTAFLLVHFFKVDAGLDGNFFLTMSYGYWIACGALFLPFVAMFFLDKSI